jgi:hypothetical protein
MAGTKFNLAIKAGEAYPQLYPIEPGETIRLVTAASSTARLEISYDGGFTWKPWAFGTQAQSLTKSEVLLKKALVRAVAVTGTATFEADAAAATEAHSRVIIGLGTPASLVAAPPGTLYLRTDADADTALYIKETGTDASGWTAMAGV